MCEIFISVREDDIDPTYEINQLSHSTVGAIASFFGTVRDSNSDITSLHLEHYEGMTQKQITAIAQTAADRWSLHGIRIIHRIGRLEPTDMIVMVAASSAHRAESLEAVHFIMDYLKTDAPFWKAEEIGKSLKWVDARETDKTAKDKWQKR